MFFNGIPVTPPQSQTFEHLSDLQNYELNFRRRVGRFRFLAGVRHFKTEESYDIFNTGSGVLNRVGSFSTTTNSLVGVQVGAGATLWSNEIFTTYATLKYALMNNSVDGRAEVEDVVGEPLILDYSDERGTRLWDLEIAGFAAIGQSFGVKAGYRGIIGEDIATATDLSGSLDIFTGEGNFVYSTPEWHGFFITFEGAF